MTTQFITDQTGKKLAVVLPIREYVRMMEELDDLRISVNTKDLEKGLPVEEAFRQIEAGR